MSYAKTGRKPDYFYVILLGSFCLVAIALTVIFSTATYVGFVEDPQFFSGGPRHMMNEGESMLTCAVISLVASVLLLYATRIYWEQRFEEIDFA